MKPAATFGAPSLRACVTPGRHRQLADLLPAHLQVAGAALVVGGVEHEVDAVVLDHVEAVHRHRREQALALVVGMRRRVDRTHGVEHLAATDELPAHERPQADDLVAVGRHPHVRRAERVLVVLPREQLLEARIVTPAERGTAQLDDRRSIVGRRLADVETLRERAPRLWRLGHRTLGGCLRREFGVGGFDAVDGAADVEVAGSGERCGAELLAQGWIGDDSLECVGERRRIARGDEEGVDAVVHLLGDAADVRRHHRQAERQGFHQGDGQALPLRGQREDVAGAHHPHGVVTEPGEDHAVAEAEVVVELADLRFLRALADCHESHGHLTVGEQPGRLEQVRVVLLRAEVGDRADDDLVEPDPEFGPHGVTIGRRLGRRLDVDAVLQGLDPLGDGAGHRLAHLVGDGERHVVPPAREPVQPAGRAAMGGPTVVFGAHQARPVGAAHRAGGQAGDRPGEGGVDVDDVPLAVTHQLGQAQRPAPIGALAAHAVRLHPGPFELLGEMVLPRQHEGALDVEALVVVSASRGTQQPFRPTWPEPLDHPEDTCRHDPVEVIGMAACSPR
jgi:hypothetical protein